MTLYLSDLQGNDNEITARMNPAKEKDLCHNLRKYFREYNEVTGIHGLRYLTEKRSRTEKVVWAVLLLSSLAGCIYMIYEILYKYNNSPVVVSFATEDTPLFQIPFPAITICPESKYSREKFNYSKVHFQLQNDEKINEEELKIFYHISLLCDEDKDINLDANKTVDNNFFETIDKLKPDPLRMLQFCYFMNTGYECKDVLTPVVIDEGICYSFNILGRHELFRPHVVHYTDYYNVVNDSRNVFDSETGYKKNAGVNTYPRRALMSGADNALEVFFNYDTADSDFVCNSFLQGFRVLIHNPWDVPRVSNHYFRIPFDKVVVAAIEPELVTTSDSVRTFSPEKRKCYMKDERPLKHFKDYSQSNCLLECSANYTLSKCGCAEFFMPRDNNTAICGVGSSKCVEAAERELKIKELNSKIKEQTFCDCKPSCTNLRFKVETSHSDFYFKEFFQAQYNFKVEDDGSHWSIVQIYFKDEQFMTLERNELYGTSDLISNLGGLLGLFTGFSLISLVEIIYFLSLRLFCNERMYGMWSGPPS